MKRLALVRELFSYAIRNVGVRIPAGPNQGSRWSLATAGRGYGNGTFEPSRVETIAVLIQPGDCFWDVGAHKGYVTLLAARRVGESGRVYAFEPARTNLWFVRKHLQWNRIRNATIVPAAISNFDGTSRFGGGSSLAFRLGEGRERVTARSVHSLIESGECKPPTFLKVDAEGAEADILDGARKYLECPRMAVLVSVHSPELYLRCKKILEDHAYRIIESGQLGVANARGWVGPFSADVRGDPDLLGLGPDRFVPEDALSAFIRGDCPTAERAR